MPNTQLKNKTTNWTKKTSNCLIMAQLLKDCIIKSQLVKPCPVYRTLLTECKKTKK